MRRTKSFSLHSPVPLLYRLGVVNTLGALDPREPSRTRGQQFLALGTPQPTSHSTLTHLRGPDKHPAAAHFKFPQTHVLMSIRSYVCTALNEQQFPYKLHFDYQGLHRHANICEDSSIVTWQTFTASSMAMLRSF
ncbi:unnamed protein product [Mycena citricolor]|uniref:Uncharacterized protein n=1 Tax=Mycena citricolor TaxID=2018698 RepID=A0AAD2H5L9_9AGAR|nr:unnamed protein product [Mycena citricolor]